MDINTAIIIIEKMQLNLRYFNLKSFKFDYPLVEGIENYL